MKLAASLALALAAALQSITPPPPMLANPLLPSGPDPYIVTEDGWFYFMATLGDRLAIRRTRDLGQLAAAEEVTVWRPPADGPNAVSIWAPELHRIGGKWYIYYTAAARGHDDDAHRGVFVLENDQRDPRMGAWIDRGRIATRKTGIDGTVFEAQGKHWFVYSAYDGPDSVLAISAMRDPWSLAGPEVVIARPDRAWERRGGRQILEGPAFLRSPTGGLSLAYSGSACWSDDYAIGLLRADPRADLLEPTSWQKTPQPVFAKSPAANVYAPGHNAFFTAAKGRETWIVYHANTGAAQGCTARRSPRVQPMRWSADGAPVFPAPVRTGEPIVSPQP